MRLVTVLCAAAGMLSATAVLAQGTAFPPAANFGAAREEFVNGKMRPAATSLRIASVEVRRQIGRSHDEAIGMQLLAAEDRFERLAASVAAGSVKSVSVLTATFAATDRLLAEHHAREANLAWSRKARASMDTLAIDLGTAASYFERAFGWEDRAVPADAAAMIAEARAAATAVRADPRNPPKETGTTIASLIRHITAAAPVVVAEHPK